VALFFANLIRCLLFGQFLNATIDQSNEVLGIRKIITERDSDLVTGICTHQNYIKSGFFPLKFEESFYSIWRIPVGANL